MDANGQMQMILSTVTAGGTVTAVSTKSYTLDNWVATVKANWRFLFGARNADDNHRMRVYLDSISLSGDTAPIFGSVPSVTFNEDQPNPNFQFTAGDYESVNVTASAALADPGGVLSGVSISGSSNTTFTVSPQLIPNASGTARIQLIISAGNLSASREVVVTVNPVNDPPALSAIGPGSTSEDTLGSVTFTATDPDNSTLTVTALTSDNQSLIPNANLSVVGGTWISAGQLRTLQFRPATNATGTCNVTLQVSDGLASAGRTFRVSIAAVNDAPTFTSLPPVTMNEDTSVTANFTVGDIETPVQSLTVEVMSSSDPTLIPTGRISLGGSGANRTITLTPQPNRSGSRTIQLRVSDGRHESGPNEIC